MTETTRHAKYGKSSGLNRSLENSGCLAVQLWKGRKQSNHQNMCGIPELRHRGLAESWMRNSFLKHLEAETAFSMWIYCLVWGVGLLFCPQFKRQLKCHFSVDFLQVSQPHPQEAFSLSLPCVPRSVGFAPIWSTRSHFHFEFSHLLIIPSPPLGSKLLGSRKHFTPSTTHTQTPQTEPRVQGAQFYCGN